MKVLSHLICLGLMLTPCLGEVLWVGGPEEGRLTLATGNALGNWYESKDDELNFNLRLQHGASFFFPGSGVGPIVGLLREGLAADARGLTKKVAGCTINFQQDGKIELVFVSVSEKREFTIHLTRSEARELVRITGAFFDERIAKHAKAEKDAGLD